MHQLIIDLHDPYIENCLIVLVSGCLLLLFYILMISPKQHEKSESRRTTKAEIENLFDTVDPINPAKIQRFSDN